METVEFQIYVFSCTVYGGIIIGILYDLYRLLKGKDKSGRLITSIWDVMFLFAVLLVAIWAIFSSNYGDMRAYVFIGFIVGFYLYEKLLGRLAVAVFLALKRTIIRFFRTTNSLMILPFKFLFNLLWHPLMNCIKYMKNKIYRFKKLKVLPRYLLEDSRKYYKLVIKKRNPNK